MKKLIRKLLVGVTMFLFKKLLYIDEKIGYPFVYAEDKESLNRLIELKGESIFECIVSLIKNSKNPSHIICGMLAFGGSMEQYGDFGDRYVALRELFEKGKGKYSVITMTNSTERTVMDLLGISYERSAEISKAVANALNSVDEGRTPPTLFHAYERASVNCTTTNELALVVHLVDKMAFENTQRLELS
jgi:hypothetical protein